jgi:endonuclease/exonuclease/phosphatase family metal-dependent hydrolase
MRVVTLNIWNRQGPWERRRELIRAGLVELNPDLIALQEVLHMDGQPEDQATEVVPPGYHVVFGSGWHIGGGLHIGNAIASRWPIREHHTFALETAPGEAGRCLVHALVDGPAGAIPFYVTHLDWKFHLGPFRLAQCRFIAERILEGPSELPPILAGDFNAEPDSDEIRFLGGKHYPDGKAVYFADCFGVSGEGAGHTFARRNPYAVKPVREPDRRIDYVFVRGPDKQGRGDTREARVVFDQPADDGVWPSDHFGVLADLS